MTTIYRGFEIVCRAVNGAAGVSRYFVNGAGFKEEGYGSEGQAKSAITRAINAAETNAAAPVTPAQQPEAKPATVVATLTAARAISQLVSRRICQGVYGGSRQGKAYRAGRSKISPNTKPSAATVSAILGQRLTRTSANA